MKLTTSQLRRVEEQLGTEAIPEENPVTPKLREAFGDHTFFLDVDGLNVIEADSSPESTGGRLVRLASWTDDRSGLLQLLEPEGLEVTVVLGPEDEPDPAA